MGGVRLTLHELFAVQKDLNQLKSLYLELAAHEEFNPYKKSAVTGMPKGSKSMEFSEWYTQEHNRLLGDIAYCKEKIQEDRKILDRFIEDAPYPECDIIRFRVINGLGWNEIGEELSMDRRTAARKFYDYIKLPTMPA